MGREPDESRAFVFDLVDDDAGDSAAPAAPSRAHWAGGEGSSDGDVPETGAPPSSGLSRTSRRLAPVAAVLAVALGTGFAVDGLRDNARMERVRDLRGGVVDVSSPLEETWAWEGVVGSRSTFEDENQTQVAALGDVLAFESEGGLVALNPATGEEAWTVPLGEDPECGPTDHPAHAEIATAALVCLQGSGGGREVVVVGPDGVASAPRALEAGDARRHGEPRPGPDGTVLRAKRAGSRSAVDLGTAECPGLTECTGTVEAGRDLLIRAEDAVTGEVRWSVALPFGAMEAEACWTGQGMPWDGAQIDDQLDPDAFGARIGADLVVVRGCGLRAAVTADGVVLRTDVAPGPSSVFGLDTGGYVAQTIQASDGRTNSTLFSPDGDVVGEIAGSVSRPQTTDEPDAAMLFATDQSGQHLRSYGSDGTQRWDAAVEGGGAWFLAQVAGTAVATTWEGKVHGLDLATGDRRWVWDPTEGLDDWTDGSAYVSQVFSDGQSVLLLLWGARGSGLVSLDAASGALVWDGTGADVATSSQVAALVAVDGNLLEVSPTGVRGIG